MHSSSLNFKKSLQNNRIVYNRGIWHDETLTPLEPEKNIHSLIKKNKQILDNNAYSLPTLISDNKIMSTSSLDTKSTQWLEDSSRSSTTRIAANSRSQHSVAKRPR